MEEEKVSINRLHSQELFKNLAHQTISIINFQVIKLTVSLLKQPTVYEKTTNQHTDF